MPVCEITLLDERYSPRLFKEFVIVFKITSVTGRPTLSCFQAISLAGRFAAYLCHCMAAIQHFFSVADHLRNVILLSYSLR